MDFADIIQTPWQHFESAVEKLTTEDCREVARLLQRQITQISGDLRNRGRDRGDDWRKKATAALGAFQKKADIIKAFMSDNEASAYLMTFHDDQQGYYQVASILPPAEHITQAFADGEYTGPLICFIRLNTEQARRISPEIWHPGQSLENEVSQR